jgi:hypothetical protein
LAVLTVSRKQTIAHLSGQSLKAFEQGFSRNRTVLTNLIDQP